MKDSWQRLKWCIHTVSAAHTLQHMVFKISLYSREYALVAHSQACLVLEQSMTEFCLPLTRALEGRHEHMNLVFYAHLFTSMRPFCSFSIDLWLESFGFDVNFSFLFFFLFHFFKRKVRFFKYFSCWSDEFHHF